MRMRRRRRRRLVLLLKRKEKPSKFYILYNLFYFDWIATRKTSVQRLADDIESEKAGVPSNLSKYVLFIYEIIIYLIWLSSEQLLEDSNISIAPPQRPLTRLADLPPVSAPAISGRIRRAAVFVPVVSKLPSQDISTRSASVVLPFSSKLPSKDVTSVNALDSANDTLELSSTDSSEVDDDDMDMDKTPRKLPAKRTRVSTPESDTPSTASRVSKVTRRSTSHSSASQSDVPDNELEPSVSHIPSHSGSPIDPQGSSSTTGGLNRG